MYYLGGSSSALTRTSATLCMRHSKVLSSLVKVGCAEYTATPAGDAAVMEQHAMQCTEGDAYMTSFTFENAWRSQ